MGKFTVTQEINCNLETFWNRWFDKGITENAYRETLGYIDYTILEQVETDEDIFRKVMMRPKMDFPAPAIKIMGPGFYYTEESRFNKTTKVLSWKRIPNTLIDKLRVEGTVHAEAMNDTNVRCITEIALEVRIFGIGGIMESSFEKHMREELDRYAAYLNELT